MCAGAFFPNFILIIPLRLVIADDHSLVREGLKLLLKTQSDFDVVGEASRAEDACRLAQELHPDVIIMDVAMPGLGGAGATQRLRQICPGVKVLAFSGYEDELTVRQMMASGAKGYVVKRTAVDEIVHAVRAVAEGGTYLDSVAASKLVHPAIPQKRMGRLSEREHHVLRLIARGLNNKEVAHLLCVSSTTVETDKATISTKLGLVTRADMLDYALKQGWLKQEVC